MNGQTKDKMSKQTKDLIHALLYLTENARPLVEQWRKNVNELPEMRHERGAVEACGRLVRRMEVKMRKLEMKYGAK